MKRHGQRDQREPVRQSAASYAIVVDERGERLRNDAGRAARRASQSLRNRPAATFGPIAVATALPHGRIGAHIQLRSKPFAELAGGELRYAAPFGQPGQTYVEVLSDEVVDWAEALWKRRDAAARLVEDVRSQAREILSRSADDDVPTLESIGIARGTGAAEFDVVLDLRVAGPGSARRVARVHASGPRELDAGLSGEAAVHAAVITRMAQFERAGIQGEVQDTTQRVLAAAGIDADFAMMQLATSDEFVFDIHQGEYRCTLRWSNGVIKCDLQALRRGWHLVNETLWLDASPGISVLQDSLEGRRLGDVFSNDLLPSGALMKGVQKGPGGRFAIALDVPRIPLPNAEDPLDRQRRL